MTSKPTTCKSLDKAAIVQRKGASATRRLRTAACMNGCGRTEATSEGITALLAESGYGRRWLCLDCLAEATHSETSWPSVHGRGQGAFDWRIEVRPYGAPTEQAAVTLQLFHAHGWMPCATETDELAWRAAEPSLKWTKLLDSLEFAGLHGVVQVWVREKGAKDWDFRARFCWRGAEHMRNVLQACKF